MAGKVEVFKGINMLSEEILDRIKYKKCLVTGGTGLIGRQVVEILCDAESEVTSVSLDKIKLDKRAKYEYVDLSNFEECKRITKNKDYVFHIAGVKGSVKVTKERPSSFFVPLLMMNTNILEACRLNEVEKVVYTSSVGAYSSAEVFKEDENLTGEPMDMFPGWAKRMAEKQIESYAIQYGLKNFAVVRPANIYGPGDNFDPENAMVIPTLMQRVYRGEDPVVVWGDGSAVRDFAYSKDVAEGIIQAMYYGTNGKFVNLGCGKGISIKELVETLHRIINFNYEFDTAKPSGFPIRVMDISLARKLIRYNPSTSLEDGLRETWEWFIKNSEEYKNRQNYFKEIL
jgi:GDP-L-fucose synthase